MMIHSSLRGRVFSLIDSNPTKYHRRFTIAESPQTLFHFPAVDQYTVCLRYFFMYYVQSVVLHLHISVKDLAYIAYVAYINTTQEQIPSSVCQNVTLFFTVFAFYISMILELRSYSYWIYSTVT